MASYKFDAYARILSEAEKVKPIEGMDNVYAPEDYTKLRGAELLMGSINSGEYLEAQLDLGAVEYDQHGRLKKVGRNRPAMLDLNTYTANAYMVQVDEKEEKFTSPDKDGKPEEHTRVHKTTDLVIVMGVAIVRAIRETRELPPTVRAFRFRKDGENGWRFIGGEFIKSEQCYSMTKTLNPDAMLTLMKEMQNSKAEVSNTGDSLEDIA